MKQMLPHIGFIFKRNIRDKKNIYYIIMMSVCSLLLICSFLFQHMRTHSKDWVKENEIGMRQLSANPGEDDAMKFFADNSYDFNIEELKKIPHVVDIHSSDYDFIASTDVSIGDIKGNYVVLYYGSKGITPEVIEGKSFDVDDENVLICPNKMYIDSYDGEPLEEELIDGEKILGKTFKATHIVRTFDNEKKEIVERETDIKAKVIGLYDSSSRSGSYASCYIPGKQLEKIRISEKDPNDNSFYDFIVTVDNIENKKSVATALRDRNFIVTDKAYYDSNEEREFKNIYYFVLIVMIIAILLISLAYIKKKILNNLSSIVLAKSLGYNKNQIRNLYLIDNLVVVAMSYMISLTLFIIAALIVKNFFYTSFKSLGVKWNVSLSPFIITFVILFIISSIVNYYYISKRIRKSPFSILNGETI